VHWREQDLYAKVSAEESIAAPKAWHSAAEFHALCEQELVTRLPDPSGEMFEGAMLVYISRELLSKVEVGENECEARGRWELCHPRCPGYIVLSAWDHKMPACLDKIAHALRRSVEQNLIDWFARPEDATVASTQHLVTMAFAAAQTPGMRSRLYLQEAILRKHSSDADTLHTVHELLVQKEFPDWDWHDFLNAVSAYEEILHQQLGHAGFPGRIPSIDPNRLPPRMPRVVTVAIQAMTSESRARRSEPEWLAENIAHEELDEDDRDLEQYAALLTLVGGEDNGKNPSG
jgi:hypothetical protein